jgi:ankyrin repeat protein
LACAHGHVDVVKFLLDHGAKIESVDQVRCLLDSYHLKLFQGNKNTPLSLACTHGHVEVAAALLDCGANFEHLNQVRAVPLKLMIFSIVSGQ